VSSLVLEVSAWWLKVSCVSGVVGEDDLVASVVGALVARQAQQQRIVIMLKPAR
jgi:hypothetical protein